MRNTKIVATLGPASDSEETVAELIRAGVDVFRLNASHGSREEHARRASLVRKISKEADAEVALLLDLQGPKIRLGEFANGGCELETGATFTITTEPVLGTAEMASTNYADLARDLKPGDRILLADGAVEAKAVETDGVSVRCTVVSGGRVSNRKGINLPGVAIGAPSLTEKDLQDLEFAAAGIDLVALSFVRGPQDVARLRSYLSERHRDLPVIAKIEKPEAWARLDAILAETDGVMVARGDLGVEMALEKVPFIQKSIIERARAAGRFVITATQMLESMVENAVPTRAEVSDVANAIYDGTDAVMLSAETSIGRYPVEAVRVMARVAEETEQALSARGWPRPPAQPDRGYARIVAGAAHDVACESGAAAIVVFTASGFSAREVARYRPCIPIYAFTPNEQTVRRLAPVYGVRPVLVPDVDSTDEMLSLMDRELIDRELLKLGDGVVFVAGQPIGRSGTTNLMKLHRIGEFR